MFKPLASLARYDRVSKVILGVMAFSLLGPCRINFQEVVLGWDQLNLISAKQTTQRGGAN
jgi:hypothetical protein